MKPTPAEAVKAANAILHAAGLPIYPELCAALDWAVGVIGDTEAQEDAAQLENARGLLTLAMEGCEA